MFFSLVTIQHQSLHLIFPCSYQNIDLNYCIFNVSYSTILKINEKYAKTGPKPIPFFQNTDNQSLFYELMLPKVKIVVNIE